ncbi:hypothetical protein ABHI18_005093, partial [Aspergillus niger]
RSSLCNTIQEQQKVPSSNRFLKSSLKTSEFTISGNSIIFPSVFVYY